MQYKLQYILIGAGLALITLFGIGNLIRQQEAQANESVQVDTTVDHVDLNEINSPSAEKITEQTIEQTTEQVVEKTIESLPTNDVVLTTQPNTPSKPDSEEEHTLPWGTKDNPQTDIDIIVYTVSELAKKQESQILGKAGWLHIKWQLNLSRENEGTYHSATTDEEIPMELLIPQNPIFDVWYHVDETGLYKEALSLATSSDNSIYQQSVLVDNEWVNITLKALDTEVGQYKTAHTPIIAKSPASEFLFSLEEEIAKTDIKIYAYLENSQYFVIKEQHHDPLENVVSLHEPIIGSKEILVFDQESGQLLSSEMHSLLQNETWLPVGTKSFLTTEFLNDLPSEINKLFNESMIIAQVEK